MDASGDIHEIEPKIKEVLEKSNWTKIKSKRINFKPQANQSKESSPNSTTGLLVMLLADS